MNTQYPLLDGKELFTNDNQIYVKKSTSVPEFVDVMHTHNFIEISYIISGQCLHRENNLEIQAKQGDLFIINYMVPHRNTPVEGAGPYVSYNVGFTPGALDNSLQKEFDFLKLKSSFLLNSIFPDNNELSPVAHFSSNGINEVEFLLQNMLNEYNEQQKGSFDMLRAYLIELIVKIFRKLDNNPSITPRQKQEHYINLAIQYMKVNYAQKLKVEDIAFRSFLSKSYFCQLFKNITGLCFSEYLQNIRIEEACKKLTSSDKIISEIALDVGFNDMKSFYSVFQKHTGLTPKQYRQNAVSKNN